MPTQSKHRTYPLRQSPFFGLQSRSRLASILSITNNELRLLTRKPDSLYTISERPKKNGSGTRVIENPARPLKLVQAKIARLLGRIDPPDYLFCPVKGRCYVRNAARHLGNRHVRCLDVRRYFPSTSQKRVFWFFNKIMQCSADIAGTLAALSCYEEHLPTGSPVSPILAYFAHVDLWEAIGSLCKEHGYTLTVYIDDVTVSGHKIDAAVMWEVRKLIHRVGLRYHKEKAFRDRPAEITGVIVDGDRLLAPHRNLRKAKDLRFALASGKTELEVRRATERLSGLKGQLSQISKVARAQNDV